MDKLEKNIQRVVANKTLKDINMIVSEEQKKEKNEKYWVRIVVIVMVAAFVALLVLKAVWYYV